ncbi:MAG: hypothetical protein JWP11_3443, partial [Frankiales bacterium]|nr:hypothetical protein [Frankiales bacterium]
VVGLGTVPAAALLPRAGHPAQIAAKTASSFNDVCDVAHDGRAPSGDRVAHPFRVGAFLVSPAATSPVVTGAELRRRVAARGARLEPGTQLRYGLVRLVGGSRVYKPVLRWVLTTCGVPTSMPADPAARTSPGHPGPQVSVQTDQVALLSDSGAMTDGSGGLSFDGVCDVRADRAAPSAPVRREFTVGEIRVSPPAKGASLTGRDAVNRSAARQHAFFPGTQVRLALVEPLHRPGPQQLRWVVTTCGLDGQSLVPPESGVVNEALVYDASGRLLGVNRDGALLQAERLIRTAPPLPTPLPTYAATGPNICGPWSQAYPDFRVRSLAAGYTGMQGCYLQAGVVVIFVSSPTHGAAAAVTTNAGMKAYQALYDARFPWRAFHLVRAPAGATTAHLLRFLTPTVAEVQLSGPGLTRRSYAFDARTRAWVSCNAQAVACRGG